MIYDHFSEAPTFASSWFWKPVGGCTTLWSGNLELPKGNCTTYGHRLEWLPRKTPDNKLKLGMNGGGGVKFLTISFRFGVV